MNELVENAIAQGVVRSDVTGTDLIFLRIGLIGIAEAAQRNGAELLQPNEVDVHRRYLWLFLDALRARPYEPSQLPIGPLSTELTHRLLAQRAATTAE